MWAMFIDSERLFVEYPLKMLARLDTLKTTHHRTNKEKNASKRCTKFEGTSHRPGEKKVKMYNGRVNIIDIYCCLFSITTHDASIPIQKGERRHENMQGAHGGPIGELWKGKSDGDCSLENGILINTFAFEQEYR